MSTGPEATGSTDAAGAAHAADTRAATVDQLVTPALTVDAARLERNLATMAERFPGSRLRPHVKAHKCTALAHRQAAHGHPGFTCATIREVEGMAAAGLGRDLLLANQVVDARRLGALVERTGARVTLAVDSGETIAAAAAGGVREVLIDVAVGMPRCGCRPEDAGRLAELARSEGLTVRGVMGYEGHVTIIRDRAERQAEVEKAMLRLLDAHAAVGGDVISGGSTVSWDLNPWVTELQAGSYALMDTAFTPMAPEFGPALTLVATVISVSADWAVCDAGLKSLGMDHGDPTFVDESYDVFIVSDEHVTFTWGDVPPPEVGQQVTLVPAHVDPTVAYHEQLHLVDGSTVLERWPVDLRGW